MLQPAENIVESYIYFAKYGSQYHTCKELRTMWERQGHKKEDIDWWILLEKRVKVGETASYETRKNNLRYQNGVDIYRRVKFMGTKDDRLFIEAYIRAKYAANPNMEHIGNDYFNCANRNTIKGAENKFFAYVTEAFELLSQIKNKNYTFECEIVRS